MPALPFLRSRPVTSGVSRRAARAIASRWWPLVVLAAVLLFFASAPDVKVRSVSVRWLIAVFTGIALMAWWALDSVLRRVHQAFVPYLVAALAVATSVAVGYGLAHMQGIRGLSLVHLMALAGIAAVVGLYGRPAFGRLRVSAIPMLVAMASWAAYLDITVLVRPFRDARLYIGAGTTFSSGAPVYLKAPLPAVPADWTTLPYLYPPFTLPVFGALSHLPHALAVAAVVAACGASIVAGLLLLGVPWRVVPLLLAWPPLTIGVQVGNMACIGFLLLAATWRWGAAAPLTGVFKAQSSIVALWLVRERRWRSLFIGIAIGVVLVLVTLPFTGVSLYGDWVRSLGYFQTSLADFPSTMGLALQRSLPAAAAVAIAVATVVVGLLVGGREGLARLGIAAVAGSPTLYMHGLAFGLPALLMLDAVSFWGLAAVTPWSIGGWCALGVTIMLLVLGLSRRGLADAGVPEDSLRDTAHPLGAELEPWPDTLAGRLPITVGARARV